MAGRNWARGHHQMDHLVYGHTFVEYLLEHLNTSSARILWTEYKVPIIICTLQIKAFIQKEVHMINVCNLEVSLINPP